MYPVVRLAKTVFENRNAPRLPFDGTHVSHHICWPQDIDIYMEMNNGRILTLLDLNRTGLSQRTGLLRVLRANRLGMAMAGSSLRYRKRIKPFVKFRTVGRLAGWDDKFFYLDQSIWIGETCAMNGLFRSAVTDRNGIVRPGLVFRAMGFEGERPALPDWMQNWIDADATRPWPPQGDPNFPQG